MVHVPPSVKTNSKIEVINQAEVAPQPVGVKAQISIFRLL
jgi:hypothetical protein